MSATVIERMNVYNAASSSFIAANEDMFNGDPATDVVSMENYKAMVFIIVKNAGATGTATITVESCDDTTPSTSTAVAFHYKACTSGNTWGATTAATTSGFTTTAGANQAYMIEVTSEELSGTNSFVRLNTAEVVDSACDGAILVVAMNPRYDKEVQLDITS
jgi:hypothetical protein